MSHDSKLVPFARPRRRPDPARVEEFAATARRLQREREASAELVDNALRTTPRPEWPQLVRRPELLTSGVIERLGRLADALERHPEEALAIADLATAIADALPAGEYPPVLTAQLRAHASKDRARALCYLSRYEEALQSLDIADRYLGAFGTLAHDRAVVAFVRSIVLQHLRRFDEADRLLAHCRSVFRDHGDTRLYRKCTLAAGNLLVRRGDYVAARALLAPLLHDADAETEAIARAALGWCAIHIGSAADALEHFLAASRQYQQFAWELETVRASYGAGCAMLRLGRLDDAVTLLARAREQFTAQDLVEEAGLSGLEIVEAHMLRNEVDAARELAASLVREFTAARLDRRAVAALAYLNDAIAASSATPKIVRDVHAYIRALDADPQREFAGAN